MSELITTARPYAKALFKSAKENDLIDKYFEMLNNLSTIVSDKDVSKILSNDSHDAKYKSSLLTDILKDSTNEHFNRFINLLIDNNRIDVVHEITALYDILLQEEKSQKTAVVDTAFELDGDQITEIKNALEKRFDKKIEIKQNVVPNLLAGAVVKVDDLVIDGSFKEQLRKLESHLI
tara:strand:- start:860 stop:1393 length:534 start_codon:yes stop_codon:yes gene_type:complete